MSASSPQISLFVLMETTADKGSEVRDHVSGGFESIREGAKDLRIVRTAPWKKEVDASVSGDVERSEKEDATRQRTFMTGISLIIWPVLKFLTGTERGRTLS